ncbi:MULTISPECIES: nucleotidyltransferase-like protein [Gracilibacillus]|uniref:nucleotidyltransferase-like protein n=1 Tax=Gracilibacillus TaxID=74385 RepID=UPI0008248F19|nr:MULTISPECIES: nucleotidyltransferase-like protein [Gracilibacillus]
MEDILRPIYQERASNRNTLGILVMEKKNAVSPETDNFDSILLVIVKDFEDNWLVKHYEYGEKSAALHIVDQHQLESWIKNSTYKRVIEWVLEGRIIYDRNEYVADLKENLQTFPDDHRSLRLTMEFSKLTRGYNESRHLYETGNYLDAYSRLLRSLHYLGRMAILEKGYHPEVVVWNQVKRIDLEVYQIYEKLIKSTEDIEDKIKQALNDIDISLTKRTERCAEHLLQVMRTRQSSWGFGELKIHPEVSPYVYDLVGIIEYLVSQNIVNVVLEETKSTAVKHRKYQVINL